MCLFYFLAHIVGFKKRGEKRAEGALNYRRDSVKQILGHQSDPAVSAYAQWLASDVRNWKYLGWGRVQKRKHPDTIVFLYYQRTIGGKVRYINVKLSRIFGEHPYAIMDEIQHASIIKGNVPEQYLSEVGTKKQGFRKKR